jgi:hypothetical protein
MQSSQFSGESTTLTYNAIAVGSQRPFWLSHPTSKPLCNLFLGSFQYVLPFESLLLNLSLERFIIPWFLRPL